jgi:hypothetical protein
LLWFFEQRPRGELGSDQRRKIGRVSVDGVRPSQFPFGR